MVKNVDVSPPFDLNSVPMYYADQPAGLAIGPHVSRVTFGVSEDGPSDFPRPVVTIAIPTDALLSMVVDLSSIFGSASFKKDVANHLEMTAKKIARGLDSEVSPVVKNGNRPAKKTKQIGKS